MICPPLHKVVLLFVSFIVPALIGCGCSSSKPALVVSDNVVPAIPNNESAIKLSAITPAIKLSAIAPPQKEIAPATAPSEQKKEPEKAPIKMPEFTVQKDMIREWSIDLMIGSDRAIIDGVLVWLSDPTFVNNKTKKIEVSNLDYKATISPLLHAHKKPIAGEKRKFRVFIDPGHGGNDSGALSQDKKHLESNIVMDIANRLNKHLIGIGFETKLSRVDNLTTQTLTERTDKADVWKADIFVSIHINANPSSSPNGFETYILPAIGMPSTEGSIAPISFGSYSSVGFPGNANDIHNMQLGFSIQRRIINSLKAQDRGLKRAMFTVLRDAKMPAVLVECGFISSSKDISILSTESGREKIAIGIYQGIYDYANGRIAPGHAAAQISSQN